jgi:hypothetical protein
MLAAKTLTAQGKAVTAGNSSLRNIHEPEDPGCPEKHREDGAFKPSQRPLFQAQT